MGASDTASSLRDACRDLASSRRYELSLHDLREVPGSPFAYWLSPTIRSLFTDLSAFSGAAGHRRHAKQGLATSNDGRFVRLWYEIIPAPAEWRPIAKGRYSTTFYADIPEVLRWEANDDPARELKAYIESKPGNKHWSRRIASPSFYGRPGFTWPVRAARFAPRPLPAGCTFSHRGYSAFTDSADDDGMSLIGAASSALFDFLFKVNLGRYGYPEFLAGILPKIPLWTSGPVDDAAIAQRARRAWSLQRSLDSTRETSHVFVQPAALVSDGGRLSDRVQSWNSRVAQVRNNLSALQKEIDELCFDLYGLSVVDRDLVGRGFGFADDDQPDEDIDGVDSSVGAPNAHIASVDLAASLVSWCVGVAMGRFDVRLATGKKRMLRESDPFEALPACSPGMLVGDDGLPPSSPPPDYPVDPSDMLVDDPGHPLDVAGQVRAVCDVVFGADVDTWWSDIGEALGAKGGDVRSWLARGFFEHHLAEYSEFSRSAPILWPLGTTSGSYLVWLYAHRVTSDSLFRVVSDLVSPKLMLERRRLSELVQEAGPTPPASQRKAIDAQEKLVDELQAFVDELTAVAPLWHPDLNDGIVIALAPLWRLFAHHKAWSKELHNHWVSLVGGDYDWAQLAMHLWPERVVPKCAVDRSLAIAHGLEDVFWIRDDRSPEKWHPRQEPTSTMDQLIADRTKPATKAALEDAVR